VLYIPFCDPIINLECRPLSRSGGKLKENSEVTLSQRKSRIMSGSERESDSLYLLTNPILISNHLMNSNSQNQNVIIKTAPKFYFENERNVLRHFQGRPHIRRILNKTHDPPTMILYHLDDNILAVCSKEPLEGQNIKYVAKRVLQALQALHEDGYTHTGEFHPSISTGHNVLIPNRH
jgi:hypothetical protein